MKIAVCDPVAADRRRLRSLLAAYCERHSLDAEVQEFASGAELLARMKQTDFQVVFLETLLGEEHGIKTAMIIRRRHPGCILFFCTSSRKYAVESYELNALHYIIKPASYSLVEQAMQRCGGRLRLHARTLLVSLKPEKRVLVGDILFVEIYDKNCHVHTSAEVLTMRRTIGNLEDELGKTSFLRCHRSFIVNLEHVREYDATDFIMDNGERVPIRQAGRAAIKRAFREYSYMRPPEL